MKWLAVIGAVVVAFFAALVVFGGLGSKSNEQEVRAQQVVESQLKDPSSAKFEQVSVFQHTAEDGATKRSVCGWVNAKNGFGGYAGRERFIFDVATDVVVFESAAATTFSDLWSIACGTPARD